MVRTTKRKFISIIRKKMHQKRIPGTRKMEPLSATEIYDLFMETLTDEILKGNTVLLTGFGNFELKVHQGHKIYFTNQKDDYIDDYVTLKFFTSNVFSQKLRESSQALLAKIASENSTDDNVDDDPDNETTDDL